MKSMVTNFAKGNQIFESVASLVVTREFTDFFYVVNMQELGLDLFSEAQNTAVLITS